ncbi:aminoglycoside phosphotransferase family protein [Glycomyces sp. L485]|uniref:aminoglycoside phosphotransferase family protein n=1 Tax=Glycomyces sp. L485 TaxID=2909235 RepID=UPI001F4B5D32|nr:aminoglycoside phosphotransferase family protein [Glycomyces sp. L485]
MIDEALVRSLLSDQHPDLAGLELGLVDGGWDNQMWRLGDDLAVRLPRTERAPSLLDMEHRWVPELAPRLPLPVSVPVRLGKPTERFPKTWLVTTWVAGSPADRTAIDRGRHAGEVLAGFLAALHQKTPEDAPLNPDRGVPLRKFTAEIERSLETLDPAENVTGLRKIWNDAAAAAEWDGPPVWLHGDLHPANVVVDEGTLAGVIDFGELCAGDPATDLAAAWLLLPAGEAQRCLEEYGTADEPTIRRARGWALRRALHLIAIGRAGEMGWTGGKPTWKRAGEAALDRLLSSHAS